VNFALVPIFLALGAFVGFLAGLLGIGGGFTIVPVLMEVFEREGVLTAHVLPLAIGTSAATIVFTAVSSARAHHAHGAVAWPVVRAMAPGLVVGSLIGPQIASALPVRVMAGIFGAFIWFAAVRMLRRPKLKSLRELPGAPGLFAVGGGIGVVSGMVGTGGAFLAVPFLTRCKVSVHSAVATSAALGEGGELRAVRLSVIDNGPGFADNVLQRAFEPYITTKSKGTGLGLAVVKKIADEHRATVRIANLHQGVPPDESVAGARVSLSFSSFMTTPSLALAPCDVLEISAGDAAELGLATGDTAEVESRWGRTAVPARVSDRVAPRTLFLSFHDPETHANALTGPHRDPDSDCPEYKQTAVRIARHSDGAL